MEAKKKIVRKLKQKLSPILYQFVPGYAMYPTNITVFVNDKCPLKCKMCDLGAKEDSFAHNNVKGKGDMPLSTFKHLIDSVAFFNPTILIICVEPLVYPHIVEAVQYTKNKGLSCLITTSGVQLKELAKDLISSEIDQITVSFDGGNAELDDSIKGVPGSFEMAWEGLSEALKVRKELSHTKTRLGVISVISEHNYFGLENMVETFKKLDIDFINFDQYSFVTEEMAKRHNQNNPKYPSTKSSVFSAKPENVDVKVLEEQIKEIRFKTHKIPINFFPNMPLDELEKYYHHPEIPLERYKTCYYPWKEAHIMPNGDALVNFRCFAQVMGNILEKPFVKIWRDKTLRDFRRELSKHGLFPACTRCFALYASHYS